MTTSTYTPLTFAEHAGITLEALRKCVKNHGLIDGRFNRHQPFKKEVEDFLFDYYVSKEKGSGKTVKKTERKAEKKAEVKEVIKTEFPLTEKTETSIPFVKKVETEAPSKTEAETEVKTEVKTELALPTQSETEHKTELELAVQAEKKGVTENTIPLVTASDTGVKAADTNKSNRMELFKDVMLSAIALVSMYVQMAHTVVVIGGDDLHAWAYALSVQFTGLAMTLYKGELNYLRIFCASEFLINILYYRPWIEFTYEGLGKALLLSALISFTIYSYAEIFAARRNQKIRS